MFKFLIRFLAVFTGGSLMMFVETRALAERDGASRRANKGFGITNHIGFGDGTEFNSGIGFSYLLSPNIHIESQYEWGFGTGFSRSTLGYEEWSHIDSQTVQFKFFLGDNAYWTIGLFQQSLNWGYVESCFSGCNPRSTEKLSARLDGLRYSFGQQWQWDTFSFGIEWIGVQKPFSWTIRSQSFDETYQGAGNRLKSAEKRLLENYNLGILHFFIGWYI